MIVRLALRVAVYRKGLPNAMREYWDHIRQEWRELWHGDDNEPNIWTLRYGSNSKELGYAGMHRKGMSWTQSQFPR